MRTVLITLFCLFFFIVSCKKSDIPSDLPTCIRLKIEDISKQATWNPPAKVYSYTYQGQTVYGFSSNCCDQYNTVYDANCNVICAPSGGITGKGDEKCPDFQKEATNEKLIWQDTRKN